MPPVGQNLAPAKAADNARNAGILGSVLFVGAAIGRIRVEEAIKTIWPFYAALFLALIVVTYVPMVTMGLVDLMR